MNLFTRLSIALNKTRWDELRQLWYNGDSMPDSAGGLDFSADKNTALKFTAVFGCCRVLAETFATVPIFEYQKLTNGDREKTDDTGLYDVLHNVFNSEMSAYNAKEMAMYQINLGGNVVFRKLKNAFGGIVELDPFLWQEIGISRNKDTRKLEYKYKNKKNEAKILSREQVFHVPGPSLDGVIGMSPIEYAAQAVRLGKIYENFAVNFYKNGVLSSGVFEHPSNLNDTAYARLKEDLKKNYTGLANSGTALLLEDGMTFKQLTMKLADAELLASKKFQIEDICRVYRVPLHLVQNLDKATNNNIEHQSLEFVMYTMLPWFKRWEDCINTQLLTPQQRSAGYYYEFNMSMLLRGDQKSMAEAFAVGRNGGWLSVNDIRRMLNLNSIDNGDIYLQPLNMVEAGATPESGVNEISNKLLDEMYALIEKRGQNEK